MSSGYRFDVVPGVALEKRYDGLMTILTPRTTDRTALNSMFAFLEGKLEELPPKASVFICIDFASFKKGTTDYFHKRAAALAEGLEKELRGRVAIAARANLLAALNPQAAVGTLAEAFPTLELKGFTDRDTAIGWLVSGYERSFLR